MRVLLGVSVLAIVALGVVVCARPTTTRDTAKDTYCAGVRADLEFFIDGLERKQDPLYSPLAVRGLDRAIIYCRPDLADQVSAMMPMLRRELGYLVATLNTDEERRQRAHDTALRIFRELHVDFTK